MSSMCLNKTKQKNPYCITVICFLNTIVVWTKDNNAEHHKDRLFKTRSSLRCWAYKPELGSKVKWALLVDLSVIKDQRNVDSEQHTVLHDSTTSVDQLQPLSNYWKKDKI